MATYRVTAAAVLVRLTGADLIVERGQELPAQAPADLVDRLLRKGMIEPIGAETPEPAVEPDAPAPRKGRTPPRGKTGAPAGSGKELADLTADLVDRLLRKGMIEPIGAETPEPAVEPDAPAPRKGRTPPRGKTGAPADSGKELADLTADQLRAEAAARGIEVPEGVTDPADLVAILEQ